MEGVRNVKCHWDDIRQAVCWMAIVYGSISQGGVVRELFETEVVLGFGIMYSMYL